MFRIFSFDVLKKLLVTFTYYLHCVTLGVTTVLKGHYLGWRVKQTKIFKMAILIPEVVFNCLLGPAGGLGMPVPNGVPQSDFTGMNGFILEKKISLGPTRKNKPEKQNAEHFSLNKFNEQLC